MLLAVVELQQLPLLLLLKLHVHKSCAGLDVATVVARHRVPDDAICCCRFFSPDPSVSLSLFKHDFCECTPWQCCRMYSLDLPVILYSKCMSCILEIYEYAEPRRAAARRIEAPVVYTSCSNAPPNIEICQSNKSFYALDITSLSF